MKVLIVEDDPLHRSYLHEAVSAALPECETVIEAENGFSGEKLARDHKSAHIVMDLQMATRNGIEAARTIWKERPETRILFWSNYSDEAYVRGVSRIVPDGAVWAPGTVPAGDEHVRADVLLWCTGFRAALGHLRPLHLRAPGGGIVMAGTEVVADPRIQLVGYGPSASTIGANRAGREAVRNLRRAVGL